MPILTEKGEDTKIISELAVRHPGGHVKQKGFDIKLHQERGQDRDRVSAYIQCRQGVQRQKEVEIAQGKSHRKEIHSKTC